MADALSGVGVGRGDAGGAASAPGGNDAARQAEFEQKIVEALGLLAVTDVLSDDLKSEAEQRELEAENETAG
ncbi:MAG: hypothetical protein ACR2QF_09480 [Geminicoccaceae bacterium]